MERNLNRNYKELVVGITIQFLLLSRAQATAVKFGVLSDVRVSPDIVKDALRVAWDEVQDIHVGSDFQDTLGMDSGFQLIDPTSPIDVLQKVCKMLTTSPLFVLFVTKCNNDPGLSYVSEAVRLPVLQIAMLPRSRCKKTYLIQDPGVSSRWATFFTEADRPTSYLNAVGPPRPSQRRQHTTHGEYGRVLSKSFAPPRVNAQSPARSALYWDVSEQLLVGKYLASRKWDRLIAFYDNNFDYRCLQNVFEQLGNRMQFTTAQKLPSKFNNIFDVKACRKMIDEVMSYNAQCAESEKESPKENVIFVIFCEEQTTKEIIIDLLPYYSHQKSIHFYIVDIGWETNFLHGVLFSQRFTIITKYRSRPTYQQNFEQLKNQFSNTLNAVSAVLRKNSSYFHIRTNVPCGTGTIYPNSVSALFVSSVRVELQKAYARDSASEGQNASEFDDYDDQKGNKASEWIDGFLSGPLNSLESELKVCAMSVTGQVICRGLASAMDEGKDSNKTRRLVNFHELVTATATKSPEVSARTSHIHRAYNPFATLANRTFRVATIEDPPFVIIEHEQGGPTFSGFSIDLLDRLAHMAGFNYELYEVADRKYGSFRNGTWNGLVADLINNKADMVISAMTVTPQREQYIDFTARYMDYAVGILMKKPEPTATTFAFLRPFNGTVWYCIIGGLFTVSLLLYVLNRVSPAPCGEAETNDSSLHGTFWFVYSTLVQQGAGLCLSSVSSQIVTGVWWFFVLIMVSSYTANLAAHLTVSRLETKIKSFPDLSMQTQINYGTVRDTSIYDYLESRGTRPHDDSSMWARLWMMTNSSTSVNYAEQGIRRVKDSGGTYAFLWDVAVINYLILTDPFCSLATVQDYIFEKGYGIGVQQGDPIKDALSLGILEMEDRGELSKMRGRWWKPSGCELQEQHTRYSSQLNLENFAGVFCILAGGLVIASLVALCEICSRARKHKHMKIGRRTTNQSETGKSVEEAELIAKRSSTHPLVSFVTTNSEEIHIVIADPSRRRSQVTCKQEKTNVASLPRRSVTGLRESSRDEEETAGNGHALPLINGTLNRKSNKK